MGRGFTEAEYDIGFIGVGKMGSALVNAANRSGAKIIVSDRDKGKTSTISEEISVAVGDNKTVVQNSRFIFLCVKPVDVEPVMRELSTVFNTKKDPFVLVSMAEGISIEYILSLMGRPYSIIRMMPNSSCRVGSGIILYACSDEVQKHNVEAFTEYMSFAGYLHEVKESEIDTASAITTHGATLAYTLVDAIADAGVHMGMTKKEALQYTYEMLIGAARMLELSDKTPNSLREELCTPSGASIEAVRILHKNGFTSAVMEAMLKSHEVIKGLNKSLF